MAREGLMDDSGYRGFDSEDSRCDGCKYLVLEEINGNLWAGCKNDYFCEEEE